MRRRTFCMAKSDVMSATCMVLGSSKGSMLPFASFAWCSARFEGVIHSPSSPSDSSISSTSSTSLVFVVAASMGISVDIWVASNDSSIGFSGLNIELSIILAAGSGVGMGVPHAPLVSGTATGKVGFTGSLSTSIFPAPFSSIELGGAPLSLFCPGVLRNRQSP